MSHDTLNIINRAPVLLYLLNSSSQAFYRISSNRFIKNTITYNLSCKIHYLNTIEYEQDKQHIYSQTHT